MKGKDYYSGTTVLDFINELDLNFNRGNIIKYVSRAGSKNKYEEIVDLKKAKDYIEYEIARLESLCHNTQQL